MIARETKPAHQKILISLLLTTSEKSTQQGFIAELYLFFIRYLFLFEQSSNKNKSCVAKTPQFNAPQGNIYMGARYLDPKYSRWISTDPALGEYVPQAPVNDDAKKHNQNLPGMGGLFNSVNLSLFHYAGNNPVRYVDPDGKFEKVVETQTEEVDYRFFSIMVSQLDKDESFYGKTKNIQAKASLILTAVSLLACPEGTLASFIFGSLINGNSLLSIAYAAAESYSAKDFVEKSLRQIKTLYDNQIPIDQVSITITTERTAIVNKRVGAFYGMASDVYYRDKSTITIKAGNTTFEPIVLNQKQIYSCFVNKADFFLLENPEDFIPKINVSEDIQKW